MEGGEGPAAQHIAPLRAPRAGQARGRRRRCGRSGAIWGPLPVGTALPHLPPFAGGWRQAEGRPRSGESGLARAARRSGSDRLSFTRAALQLRGGEAGEHHPHHRDRHVGQAAAGESAGAGPSAGRQARPPCRLTPAPARLVKKEGRAAKRKERGNNKTKNAPPRPRAGALPARGEGEAAPRRPSCMADCIAGVRVCGGGARARGGGWEGRAVVRSESEGGGTDGGAAVPSLQPPSTRTQRAPLPRAAPCDTPPRATPTLFSLIQTTHVPCISYSSFFTSPPPSPPSPAGGGGGSAALAPPRRRTAPAPAATPVT